MPLKDHSIKIKQLRKSRFTRSFFPDFNFSKSSIPSDEQFTLALESSILDTPADSSTEKVTDTLLDCQEADLYANYNSSQEDSFIPMAHNEKKWKQKMLPIIELITKKPKISNPDEISDVYKSDSESISIFPIKMIAGSITTESSNTDSNTTSSSTSESSNTHSNLPVSSNKESSSLSSITTELSKTGSNTTSSSSPESSTLTANVYSDPNDKIQTEGTPLQENHVSQQIIVPIDETVSDSNEEKEYEVEKIVAKKTDLDDREQDLFEVIWLGYPGQNTWQTRAQLKKAKYMVACFEHPEKVGQLTDRESKFYGAGKKQVVKKVILNFKCDNKI